MADYDFSTLGSADLEELVCDLLNAEVPAGSKVRYKTFRAGRDKGIDILYATPSNQYSHVGQVKHYYRTGVSGLLSHLADTEADKVKKLKPQKYILATSVDLTPANSQSIHDIFKPYMKSVQDVFGKKDLNQLIEKHDEVLENHYKLWFSDTTILRKLLNSGLNFRSADFQEHELTKRMRLYVETPMFEKARMTLEENNFVIITGNPGVGKTTLAEMLTYEYIKDDFKLIFIYDDIKEVEQFLTDEESKQIIYFDDFLGSNGPEINKAQGSESALISVINRIRRSKNKKLVFTTRTFIFNIVQEQSERLKRSRIGVGEAVCSLSDYDRELKEKVLNNHIDEGTIPDELKDIISKPKVSDFIVSHGNFNPRSVEFITSAETVGHIAPKDFENYIIENFNNPEEIWRHAYLYQIDDLDRILLSTLLTFDGSVEIKVLMEAFEKRIELSQKRGFPVKVKAFETAISRLNKGFVQIKGQKLGFINPSMRDFLLNFVKTDALEITSMLESVRFASQFSDTLMDMVRAKGISFPEQLKKSILDDYSEFLRSGFEDPDLIKLALVMYRNIPGEISNGLVTEIIGDISNWEALYEDYSLNQQFMRFVDLTRENAQIHSALIERTWEIVNEVVTGEDDPERAVEALEKMSEAFKINFDTLDSRTVVDHFNQIFDDYIANEVENLRDYLLDPGEAYEKEREIQKLNQRIIDLGLDYEVDMDEFSADWDEIAMENEFRRQMDKDRD